MTLRRVLTFTVLATLAAASHYAGAQAAPAVYSDTMPNQLTITGIRTEDDYALKTGPNLQQVRLFGAGIEYRYNRWYPWEIVASARYSIGHPLDQRLITLAGGIGYARGVPYYREHWYERFTPLCSLQFGATRTSSPDQMYLYKKPSIGFTLLTSAGLDYHTLGPIVIRPFYVETQYTPFGVQGLGSLYWNYGAGIGITFHRHHWSL